MHDRPGSRRAALTAAIMAATLSLAGARAARAQAWVYPPFQQSHIVNREFTVGVADGGYDGTSWLFQWREELAPRNQLTLDAGVVPSVAGHTLAFTGLTYGYQFVQQRDSAPIEVLGTVGLDLAYGHSTPYTRIPLLVSAGHRFDLGDGVTLTPFIHPRISVEFCNHCVADVRSTSSSTVGLGGGFGVGASLAFSSRLSVRFDTAIGGSTLTGQDNAIGFAVAWSPAGLRPL